MMNYAPMNHIRFLPRKIHTLERRIAKDTKLLQRIKSDPLYRYSLRGRSAYLRKTITIRIDRNMEKLHRLRSEAMRARQQIEEALS